MFRNLISVLKLIFAILLLPIVVFSSVNFFKQLGQPANNVYDYFLWGIFSYLILSLFIYEPEVFYRKGQEIVEAVFKFFSPLVKVASFCLPIYTILFLIILGIANFVFKDINIAEKIVFLIGFSLTFHMVFTAGILKSKEEDVLKATYFFSMELIYLINLFFVAFCFNYFLESFSFIDFYNKTFSQAIDIYKLVFTQLFVTKP